VLRRVLVLCVLLFVGASAAELTLREAVILALERHPDLRKAELQVASAELQLQASQAKAVWPSVSLSLAPGQGAWPALGLVASMSLPVGTTNRLSGGLQVQMGPESLLTWNLGFSFTLDLARPMAAAEPLETLTANAEESRRALARTRNAVILNVIQGYAGLLSQQAKAEQARKSWEKAKESLASTEEKAKVGLASELEVLQARLSLIQAQLAWEQARDDFQAQKQRFFQEQLGLVEERDLVPLSVDREALVQAVQEFLEKLDLEAAVEEASEVRAAKQKLQEAQKSLEQLQRSWLPTATVELTTGPTGWRLSWTLRLDLFAPERAAQVRMAEVQVTAAQLSLETARASARQKLLREVNNVLSALKALERLPLEEERWALEEEIARRRYEAGILSEAEWRDFLASKEAFLQEAKDRELALLSAYLSLQAALERPVDWEAWMP